MERLSKDDIKLMKYINSLDIDYCSSYNESEEHPELKLFFCSVCEKPIYGIDEANIKALIHITGQYQFLKQK